MACHAFFSSLAPQVARLGPTCVEELHAFSRKLSPQTGPQFERTTEPPMWRLCAIPFDRYCPRVSSPHGDTKDPLMIP
ncbi:hypothetical protein PanWU01x14_097340 [Parasponia andersonii]|uniref:Uncharacterized protein n=1 Tax=Parasponia andersonii TaxID=3476 RepID=A0A2P5D4E5_PARAD|nr:hypothetical protein PanWU01x14_097340 [Parasponia andersonii]